MNYFMDENKTANLGLLENQAPSKVSVNDIIKDMLRSGYDPTKHKVQAVADMEKANIPKQYIDYILTTADQATVKQREMGAQAQRNDIYAAGQVTQEVVAPV